MKILDFDGNEVTSPDYSLGYAEPETLLIAHHEAVEAVEEQFHYVTLRAYPNGGKDVAKVIDVPGQAAQEAWDEVEEILRWHPYSEDELVARQAEKDRLAREERERIEAVERESAELGLAAERENARLKAQIAALLENQQFLEDCLVEMAELVYA